MHDLLAAIEPEPPISSWILPYNDRYTLIERVITSWTDEGSLIADLSDDPLTSAIATGSRRRYHAPTIRDLLDLRQTGWADLVIATHESWSQWTLPKLLNTCRRLLTPTGSCVFTATNVSLLRQERTCLAEAAAAAGLTVTGQVLVRTEATAGLLPYLGLVALSAEARQA